MEQEPALAPSAQAARGHFDRWAGSYNRSRLLASLQKKALAVLAPGASDAVLDVACGTGSLVFEIAPRVEAVAGLDLSPGMLDIARSTLLRAGGGTSSNIQFHLGSSNALPFPDSEFTAVVCTTALHHFPEPQRSIDEMARVLAPGGRVVIGDVCRDSPPAMVLDPLFRRFEAGHVGLQRKRDIEAMLTRAGLRVTASRHHWLRVYALISAERSGPVRAG